MKGLSSALSVDVANPNGSSGRSLATSPGRTPRGSSGPNSLRSPKRKSSTPRGASTEGSLSDLSIGGSSTLGGTKAHARISRGLPSVKAKGRRARAAGGEQTSLLSPVGVSSRPVLSAAEAAPSSASLAPKEQDGVRMVRAAKQGRVLVVRTCLKEGDDPDQADKNGVTALMHAVWHGRSRCIQALVRGGSDVNARCSRRGTPLHYACVRNHAQVAEYLVAAGASQRARNVDGLTAADVRGTCVTPSSKDTAVDSPRGELLRAMDGARDALVGEARVAERYASSASADSLPSAAAMQRAMSGPVVEKVVLPSFTQPRVSARSVGEAERRAVGIAGFGGNAPATRTGRRVARGRHSTALSCQEISLVPARPMKQEKQEKPRARRDSRVSATNNVIIKRLKKTRGTGASSPEPLGGADSIAASKEREAARREESTNAVFYSNRATMHADGISLKEIFETVAVDGWIRTPAQLLMALRVLGAEDIELSSLPGCVDARRSSVVPPPLLPFLSLDPLFSVPAFRAALTLLRSHPSFLPPLRPCPFRYEKLEASKSFFVNFRQFCTYAEYCRAGRGGGRERGGGATSPPFGGSRGSAGRGGSSIGYSASRPGMSVASLRGATSEGASSDPSRARSPGAPERQIFGEHPPTVFLGGACNPTTWRQKCAIPVLEREGITCVRVRCLACCRRVTSAAAAPTARCSLCAEANPGPTHLPHLPTPHRHAPPPPTNPSGITIPKSRSGRQR